MKYDFPGNVRELENIIERGVALASSSIILPESLSLSSLSADQEREDDDFHISSSSSNNALFCAVEDEQELFDTGLEKVMTRLEKRIIKYALEKTGNSKMKAAELLQVSFRSLRYKTKKYNID
jgi:two-component system response regulator PilR (NtrC family)